MVAAPPQLVGDEEGHSSPKQHFLVLPPDDWFNIDLSDHYDHEQPPTTTNHNKDTQIRAMEQQQPQQPHRNWSPLTSIETDYTSDSDRQQHHQQQQQQQDRKHLVSRRMHYLTAIAAIGGFLSGYNTGVLSGALLPLTRVFDLSHVQTETIVFSTIVAAFVSSMLLGGPLTKTVGRRPTLLLSAAVFCVGALVLTSAWTYGLLVVGEVILGVGIGLESLTSPMYIAEVAHPQVRGMLVSAYALMMCFGQFFAGIVDGIFGYFSNGWRFMFGTAAVPGLVMLVGFWGLPESPAWLMAQSRHSEATTVLQRYRESDQDAHDELEAIKTCLVVSSSSSRQGKQQQHQDKQQQQTDQDTTDPQKDPQPTAVTVQQMLSHAPLRRALVVGCSLMVLQQFCGVNVVMYYSATIYRMTGFEEVTAIWLAAVTALAQLVGLGLSLRLVETAGRRPLILWSFAGVGVCCLGLDAGFYLERILSEPINPHIPSDPECLHRPAWVWSGETQYCYDCTNMDGCGFCGGACVKGTAEGWEGGVTCAHNTDWHYDECTVPVWVSLLPIVFMVLFLIVFGVGAAGLPWTINSEIYLVQYRSLAIAMSTGVNWLCNLAISSTFLTLSDPSVLTLYGSFGLYGILSLLGVAWLYWVLPETKGLTYEQIEQCFVRPNSMDTPLYRPIPGDGSPNKDNDDDDKGKTLNKTNHGDQMEATEIA